MMPIDKILVLFGSAGLASLIYWFFLGKREKLAASSTDIKIVVSGGYSPATVYVPVGKPAKLTFLRTDANSCLEELIVPDLKISKDLPLNSPISITVTITSPGKYPFHCGMNMYHGQIIAR